MTGEHGTGECVESMVTSGESHQCSSKWPYDALARIPPLIDEGNLLGDNVQEREDDQDSEKPGLVVVRR